MGTTPFERISDTLWEIPRRGGMRVPGRIYARRDMLPDISRDKAHEQVMNVAHLPGIVGHALAMPDIHWGYGFPIGGVAAFDADEGVISPGGVGYDINCGVRLLAGDLDVEAIRAQAGALAEAMFAAVPSGVGSRGPLSLSDGELDAVMNGGARWAARRGHGDAAELALIEESGRMAGADPSAVSAR
ncbi:RtcB family protein, partial [bacterium]|nr:RtcB family protein [bacterium]MBU1675503.1 RtcB family protein [bacterium]